MSAREAQQFRLYYILRWVLWGLMRVFYRVRVEGLASLPVGGVLLVPNHLSWIDALLLQGVFDRPIRFLIYEDIYHQRPFRSLFRAIGALPVSPTRAKDAVRTAVTALRRGEAVCIFPEGEISRAGLLMRIQRGFQLIARESQCPVLPVWLDGVWGSIFSYKGQRFFFKAPSRLRFPVSVSFGEALTGDACEPTELRRRMLRLSAEAFQLRPEWSEPFAGCVVRGLMRGAGDTLLTDGLDGSSISRGMALAAGWALAGELRRATSAGRVAIVLPPGKGALIANLAVVLAGRVPVNLNFTAGRASNEEALRIAEVDTIVTASAFRQRVADFPWERDGIRLMELDRVMPSLKAGVVLRRLLLMALPAAWVARRLGGRERAADAETVLLFTSGSSGAPKGVILTQANLLGNVRQFSDMLCLGRNEGILGCLPIFHSFGSTVTLWYPVFEGLSVVSYPSPMEHSKLAELVRGHRLSLMCSTPTFLRGFLRKAEAADFASLKLVVTGAEKLPMDLAEAFERRFGVEVLQGYGLTETSPVVSVNLPMMYGVQGELIAQAVSRKGSVGKPAPGVAVEVRDPETGALMPHTQTGMLWFRGVNIFRGYLKNPEQTAAMLAEGWLRTGDLGRMDEDGFLYIEGRLTRFSKIGGEMVPHETLESRLVEVLGLPTDERVMVVTGVSDPSKGESLVLLSTREVDLPEVQRRLAGAGIPNLWMPRRWVRIETVPLLASGKLDLKACREIAQSSGGLAV
jgi:acyl-[acyl-carrier-protein]-phospholipid O-acyltransferase/long-chain-fatty-acid--[acyl-carrier-protein] ligase